MPVVLTDRRVYVKVQHRFIADRFPVVFNIGRDSNEAACSAFDNVITDMKAHGSLDNIDELLKRVTVRPDVHTGLQPVHDQQNIFAAKTRTGDPLAYELFRQGIPGIKTGFPISFQFGRVPAER